MSVWRHLSIVFGLNVVLQEETAVVLLGTLHVTFPKTGFCSHGWHVSWIMAVDLTFGNKSSLWAACVCMYGTEEPLCKKRVYMMWSSKRLACLTGICITISGIRCSLLLLIGGVGARWHLIGIFDKVMLSVPSERDEHIQTSLSAAVELNLEWGDWTWRWLADFCFPFLRVTVETILSQSDQTHTQIYSVFTFVVVMLLQWGVISKSTANQTSNDDRLQKRVAENGDRLSLEGSSASHGNSAGTKARSKKTVGLLLTATKY